MAKRITSIEDVVSYQLCAGCGVCAYLEPARFEMGDVLEYGRRPFFRQSAAPETGEALLACPGASLSRDDERPATDQGERSFRDAWGTVIGVWEGHAADPEIRFAGSSGGAATALATYCLDVEGMEGVLHTAARGDVPYLNETVMSRNRADLLKRAGSRYAPASPADGLKKIEECKSPCVFIGKPCDVAAVVAAGRLRPKLQRNLGMTIGFFCAGVPTLKGNFELLAREGVGDPGSLIDLRYRGQGWPGNWEATYKQEQSSTASVKLSYSDSWGFLQKFRQWRCYICPDHSGEFSDVAVGDPWYRKILPGESGSSLIVARTERGRKIVEGAARAGYLVLEREDPGLLPKSQPNLLLTRGNIFARLIMLRFFGAAVPQFRGFKFLRFWWSELGLFEKLAAFARTPKRIFAKKLTTPIRVVRYK